jgi:glycine/D-amino acid oxidase-like deaminating enzyme
MWRRAALYGAALVVPCTYWTRKAAATEAADTTEGAEGAEVAEPAEAAEAGDDFDVGVVGGGVCGLATALRCAKLGRRVCVFEREEVGAFSQASSINSGILESFSSLPTDLQCEEFLEHVLREDVVETLSLEDALLAGTLGMWANLSLRHRNLNSLEFERRGLLMVLQTEEESAHARQHMKPSGVFVDAKKLPALEPGLDSSRLAGAILYPSCATAHPAKVMLALKFEALKAGVVFCERTEVSRISQRAGHWIVDGNARPHRMSCMEGGEGEEESTPSVVVKSCRALVLACGGLSQSVARLADKNIALPVVPVVGQMFETSPSDVRLQHLICGYDSHMWWHEHPHTSPPNVTHELGENDRWTERKCRHLYGKQTREGRFIFGGDRRVHPFQPVGYAHELPRLVEDMHRSCFEYAQSVTAPGTLGKVTRRWGGIMPFSLDGKPIIGRLTVSSKSNAADPTPLLYCVTGLGGSGFMRGGMAGTLLAEVIAGATEGRRKRARMLLSAASPQRFMNPSVLSSA